jgi:hypothetical protein
VSSLALPHLLFLGSQIKYIYTDSTSSSFDINHSLQHGQLQAISKLSSSTSTIDTIISSTYIRKMTEILEPSHFQMPGDDYIFPSNFTFGSRLSSSHYNPYSSPPTQTLESHVDPLEQWRGLAVSEPHQYDAISAASGVSSVALAGLPVSEPLLNLYKPIPAYTSSPELEHSLHTTAISSSHHYSPMLAYDGSSLPNTPGLSMPQALYSSPSMASNGFPLIAPQPIQPTRLGKRSYSHDISASPATPPQPKRRKSTSKDFAMSEDDTLLLKLKDDESLPWKTIAKRFLEQGRGEFKVPTLQMRYKRLKEKIRVWDNEDVCLPQYFPYMAKSEY